MSPKRRRLIEQVNPLHALNTGPFPLPDDDEADTNLTASPRSKVAEGLRTLKLRPARSRSITPTRPELNGQQDAPKGVRPIASMRQQRAAGDLDSQGSFLPATPRPLAAQAQVHEIRETPGAYTRFPSSPPPSPPSQTLRRNPSHKSEVAMRLLSPPPPTPAASPAKGTLHMEAGHAASDLTLRPAEEADADADTSMTWQDSEITGHEIDTTSGDDGEGINGIGFRPTPAMAAARSMSRQRQISEWRAREAREARQRRFEKRKTSGGRADAVKGKGGAAQIRRVVHFDKLE